MREAPAPRVDLHRTSNLILTLREVVVPGPSQRFFSFTN